MWSLDCHGEAVVHRFVIGIGILTIKTPNKRVQSQCLESLVRLLRELFGLVLHTPLSLHEIEVVAHGIAEMSLNEHAQWPHPMTRGFLTPLSTEPKQRSGSWFKDSTSPASLMSRAMASL